MKLIAKFYDDLFRKVENTKITLQMEAQQISILKVYARVHTEFLSLDNVAELRGKITQSAQDLIEKCIEYRKRHSNK